MKKLLLRLETQMGIGLSLLLVVFALGLFLTLSNQSRLALINAADERQETSLRVLVNEILQLDPSMTVTERDGAVTGLRSDAIPDLPDHSLIDQVGSISGETATVFLWDPVERDFIRKSTNIIKPDGMRAVGTYLGKENPVTKVMLEGNLYSGEAVILGKSYLTRYLPVLDGSGSAIGILYVGVERMEMDAALREMKWNAAIKSTLALFLGITLLVLGMRAMLKPLGQVSASVIAIRQGDADEPVPCLDRPDSIGNIARSVEDLRVRLTEVAQRDAEIDRARAEQDAAIDVLSSGLSALADRDLTTRIGEDVAFPAGYERLKEDFNTVAISLSNALSSIYAVSHNLHAASADVGQISGDLSSRVARQAATLEETAAAIEELTRSSQTINARVAEAHGLAASSVEVSGKSNSQLDQVVEEIKKIENSSQQIDSIVNLIEDIAFQTNLLALNAGVEAARAGEAGAGFAVVASEVRGLAKRASESVGEIRELTKANIEQVKDGSRLVQSTGDSIRGVLEQIKDLGELVSDVTSEIDNQTQGLTEINAGMRDLDSATQENAALAGDSEASSSRLSTEADRLAETISAFRTDDQERHAFATPNAA
ncbi:MAG: methyl-accepting chemotaxis protein [Pseudomonadota bacterium]